MINKSNYSLVFKKASSTNDAGQTGGLQVKEYKYICGYLSAQNVSPNGSQTST